MNEHERENLIMAISDRVNAYDDENDAYWWSEWADDGDAIR